MVLQYSIDQDVGRLIYFITTIDIMSNYEWSATVIITNILCSDVENVEVTYTSNK
jgi:hypothetical protein